MPVRPITYTVPLEFRDRQLAPQPRNDLYRMAIHHTVTVSPLRKRDVLALIRQMHQWHLDKGWAGEGYHYIVDRLGRVYKARPLRYVGAHTLNQNTGNIGVAVLGDFSKPGVKPNTAQRNALRWLVEHHKAVDRIAVLGGHREYPGQATACPGNLLSYVRWMRSKYALGRP